MVELFGDSSGAATLGRGPALGRRRPIVRADAPGLDARPRGLTLLEAAAVGGETLAVDALANAIAPAVRAAAATRGASRSR